MRMRERSTVIDQLKGLAIICVVLYHLGVLQWGYYGVDVFFAIAGYLSARSALKHCESRFSPLAFVISRVKRLLPLVIVASLVVLLVGAVIYFPSQYKDASRSIVASSFFLNNIQMWRSAGDYWATSNEMKPLMHLWYLGALMQMYVIFSVCMCGASGLTSVSKRLWFVAGIGLLSFALWFFGIPDEIARYYFGSSRYWEFAVGIFVALLPMDRLSVPSFRCLEILGRASFSIYIWHQIVIAFIRYVVTSDLYSSLLVFCATLGLVAGLSYASYMLFERDTILKRWISRPGVLAIAFLLVTLSAFVIWRRQGFVSSVPELEMMSPSDFTLQPNYVDRIRHLATEPFSDDGRTKILFIGDSFARDLVNVFYESVYSNKVDISYCETSNLPADFEIRLGKADAVLYTRGVVEQRLPEFLEEYISSGETARRKVFVVGYKYLGEKSMGRYRLHRYLKNEWTSFCRPSKEILEANKRCAEKYGQQYVDLISCMMDEQGRICIISSDGMMMTPDCYHLSRQGAIKYSRQLPCHILEVTSIGCAQMNIRR